MPLADTSQTARTLYKRDRILASFRSLNPTQQLEGPLGMTPSSTLTAAHVGQRPFILNGVISKECCNNSALSCNLLTIADIATLVGVTYTLNGNTTIPECNTVTVPIGFTLVIPQSQTLVVYGTLIVAGSLDVFGTLLNYGFNTLRLLINSVTTVGPGARVETSGKMDSNGTLAINAGANLTAKPTAITKLNGATSIAGTAILAGNTSSNAGANTTVSGSLTVPANANYNNQGAITTSGAGAVDGTVTGNPPTPIGPTGPTGPSNPGSLP